MFDCLKLPTINLGGSQKLFADLLPSHKHKFCCVETLFFQVKMACSLIAPSTTRGIFAQRLIPLAFCSQQPLVDMHVTKRNHFQMVPETK